VSGPAFGLDFSDIIMLSMECCKIRPVRQLMPHLALNGYPENNLLLRFAK
jgi:hypothetical protein